METFWVEMVKNVTGIDISSHRGCMPSTDSGGTYGWFVDVQCNGMIYRAVKVYPGRVEFYKDHPMNQTGPTIIFIIGPGTKKTFF
jgi:hypothetical protein